MVQLLLAEARGRSLRPALQVACAVLLLLTPALASRQAKVADVNPPDLLLEGGRKLSYERSFSSEREVKPKRGFWNKVLDVVAGEPNFHFLVRPYSVITDSRGRIIVTDPGAHGIHIFDFTQQKYKFISRKENTEGSDALSAMRGTGCRGQHLRDRFGCGQSLRLRLQRKV